MPQKHLQYLNDKDKQLAMLNRHTEIKQLFLRYNSTLSSNAPVERLFSAGALILTKQQNRLSDSLSDATASEGEQTFTVNLGTSSTFCPPTETG